METRRAFFAPSVQGFIAAKLTFMQSHPNEPRWQYVYHDGIRVAVKMEILHELGRTQYLANLIEEWEDRYQMRQDLRNMKLPMITVKDDTRWKCYFARHVNDPVKTEVINPTAVWLARLAQADKSQSGSDRIATAFRRANFNGATNHKIGTEQSELWYIFYVLRSFWYHEGMYLKEYMEVNCNLA